MRRYGWLIAGLLLLVLWGWSQRPVSTGATAAGTTQATRDGNTHAPRASVPDTAPRSAASSAAGTAHARAYPAYLPDEALDTLRLIARGGPYPHRQDGGTFQNRERRLPSQSRGYYREYTVRTPGSRDRGARRIIAGGDPPEEFFYTDDHYRSFRRFAPAQATR